MFILPARNDIRNLSLVKKNRINSYSLLELNIANVETAGCVVIAEQIEVFLDFNNSLFSGKKRYWHNDIVFLIKNNRINSYSLLELNSTNVETEGCVILAKQVEACFDFNNSLFSGKKRYWYNDVEQSLSSSRNSIINKQLYKSINSSAESIVNVPLFNSGFEFELANVSINILINVLQQNTNVFLNDCDVYINSILEAENAILADIVVNIPAVNYFKNLYCYTVLDLNLDIATNNEVIKYAGENLNINTSFQSRKNTVSLKIFKEVFVENNLNFEVIIDQINLYFLRVTNYKEINVLLDKYEFNEVYINAQY